MTRLEGHAPLGPPLARALASHAITVDVLNPAFIAGFGHKSVLGFAAGGFVLMNRQRDFVDTFGDEGEAASTPAPTNSRLRSTFISPSRRCGARSVAPFARSCSRGIACTPRSPAYSNRLQPNRPTRASSEPAQRQSVPVLDLLPQLHRWGTWPWQPDRVRRRSDGVVVSCHAEDRGYAARAALPEQIMRLNEPHLALTLATEAGRMGVGLLKDPSAPPILEQMVGPSRTPVEITLELSHDRRSRC